MYLNRNMNYTEEISLGDEKSLHKSQYDKSKSVILIIHGFLSSAFGEGREAQTLKNGMRLAVCICIM
jgi:hypothetical protein